MAVPITSSTTPAAALSTPAVPASKRAVAESAPTPVPPTADTVKLSLTAQVHLLRSQGQSAQQIGSGLGLSTATISGYLGAQLPKVVVKVVAAASPVVVSDAAPEDAPTTPVPASQLPSAA